MNVYGVKASLRFYGIEYLTVEGDFDVNAFLQQFPSYDEMKEK